MEHLIPVLCLAAAYLIGAIPFGYLVAKSRGIDIFQHGSGNIGATNVSRVVGRKFGILVFVLDFLKGAVPVAIASWLEPTLDSGFWKNGMLPVGVGIAAFVGHLFPVYLKFRGGKGVATAAGVVVVLFPVAAPFALLAWLVVVAATRHVSLGSVLAALVLCWVHAMTSDDPARDPRSVFCVLAGGLVIGRHRSNIQRLWHGTESQVREFSLMKPLTRILHVMSLGFWVGMSVFFTFVVALSLFQTFESAAEASPRPTWFPPAEAFAKNPKEQGTRAAGVAVGPMFRVYFPLQGFLGFVALATSLSWARLGKLHAWRTNLLILAVFTILIGWPIEKHVEGLRPARDDTTEAFYAGTGSEADMNAARGEFARWHVVSLFLNFGTILLIVPALAMAAFLPAEPKPTTGGPP